MQTASSKCFTKSSVASRQQTRPAYRSLAVRCSAEDSTRRAAIGSILLGTAALFSSAAAEAKVKIPSQDSQRKGGSSSASSMSSFDMEGIKKRGLKPSQRKNLLEEAKSKAQQLANKASP